LNQVSPSPPASGQMANVNGVEIDLMPNEGMRTEAQRYRDWKSDGEGGGTDVARTRASQILSGNELSADTVVTMSAWFARHEVDNRARDLALEKMAIPAMEGWLGPLGEVMLASLGQTLVPSESRKHGKVDNLLAIMRKNS
jgi:hypothetical protein